MQSKRFGNIFRLSQLIGTPIHGVELLFRALTVVGAIEFGAFAISFAAHPAAPGIAGQTPIYRAFFGFLWGPVMLSIGALIIWRAHGHVVGRFAILLGMAAIGGQLTFDLGSRELSAFALELFVLFGTGIVVPSFGYLMFAFPTGQIYPTRLRPWLRLFAIVKFAGVALELAVSQGHIKVFVLPVNPLLVSALIPYRSLITSTVGITGAMLPVGLLGGLASVWWRYRTAQAAEREQIKWVVWALGVFAATLTFFIFFIIGVGRDFADFNFAFPAIISSLAQGFFIIALTIAVFKHHFFDVDLLINRTLVYTLLTAIVIAIYVLIVGMLSELFQASGSLVISLLATGVVALLFQPLRQRLQRAVNRLVFGELDDPYTVLSRLGQHLEATLAPEAVLPTIAETVAQALKLPYVAVELMGDKDPVLRAEAGQAPTQHGSLTHLPLTYQGESVGQLILAPRTPGESFTASDLRLLDDITHQVGIAAHAVRLNIDLQRSRERLVILREEERRRIRRDLHDGLGPALASMKLRLDALHDLIPPELKQVESVVTELEADIQNALTDIRRLVYALRPPALDELGLLLAVKQYAASLSSGTLQISVEAAQPLVALPAAVEVAAYRIALEALTNVTKHAQAHSCVVSFDPSDATLCVTITDDGTGLSVDNHAGVGLASMRERAEELGATARLNPSRLAARMCKPACL